MSFPPQPQQTAAQAAAPAINAPEQLAAYQQNAETFRSLNQLMWQIPLIAMTLTGGLWFGVAKADTSLALQLCLLGLAAAGNVGLIVVLFRLRYIMGQYLEWAENYNPAGHVAARGSSLLTRPTAVRTTFQFMLGMAAVISVGLMGLSAKQHGWWAQSAGERAIAYYDRHAETLADNYESLTFEQTHPELDKWLRDGKQRSILDVGAGTGRDAAAMQALGHDVVAVEPADKMRALARRLHPSAKIRWIDTTLPDIAAVPRPTAGYDLVILSAVWMHVEKDDRVKALERLSSLLNAKGRLYITLRLGPADGERGIHAVSREALSTEAAAAGLEITSVTSAPDLLGRTDVRWETAVLEHRN
ncbi:class I SAM-dependent methyltransferase [Brevundimonas goettingensis]|uniref:Class I SAM-dependent methyltransferase n=1 Tax=Brevundimonas goettingensis TaxID=2774190 RepID=A0A975GUM1_9CAUL|nr:class I SAM-dependent methyltransferase [Brevundimonas goettingensis]QTC90327.1 class I SAM-dependent methyltransferase [Brevundimonas goettingensis]